MLQNKNFYRAWMVVLAILLATPTLTHAQGQPFGFGIIIGDPLGATIKAYTSGTNAFDADIGEDYFGSLRIDGDYLWHFDAFHSRVVKMYAGPGLALGFGRGRYILFHGRDEEEIVTTDSRFGLGARVIAGLDITPSRSPVEIFLQLGPLISLTPDTYVALDAAFGIRFYP